MKQKTHQDKQEIKARIKKPAFDAALMFAEGARNNDFQESKTGASARRVDDAAGTRPVAKSTDIIRADSLLPTKGEHAESFARRALHFAKTEAEQNKGIELHQFQRLSVGREAYGIPYQYLDEIMYARHITAVPCTPNYICGVIPLGGEYLCIIDLGILFQANPVQINQDASIVVVRGAGIRAGLLVQQVGNNEPYHSGMVSRPMRSESSVKRSYVKGIYKQTVTFLDIDAMLMDLGNSIAS